MQTLKPIDILRLGAARLKACPCYKAHESTHPCTTHSRPVIEGISMRRLCPVFCLTGHSHSGCDSIRFFQPRGDLALPLGEKPGEAFELLGELDAHMGFFLNAANLADVANDAGRCQREAIDVQIQVDFVTYSGR